MEGPAPIERTVLGDGWDSTAVLVGGRWVERTARRRAVEPWLRTETRLLPWLARSVPLPVPEPEVVGHDPLVVRHRLVPGDPLTTPTPAHGRVVGDFLRALHAVPLDGAVARGVPGPGTTRGMRDASLARFGTEVLPRLPAALHRGWRTVLARLADAPASVLVHGDLTGDHLLVVDGTITGVIDWSDARAGDPAKDLSWMLATAPPAVGAALVEAYGADDALCARARDWHRAGPFYTVTHGLDTDDEQLAVEGLAALSEVPPP